MRWDGWRVYIAEGSEAPRGYGVAWRTFLNRKPGMGLPVVCMPIPIHWIARHAREQWWRFKYPRRTTNYERWIIDFANNSEEGKTWRKEQQRLYMQKWHWKRESDRLRKKCLALEAQVDRLMEDMKWD